MSNLREGDEIAYKVEELYVIENMPHSLIENKSLNITESITSYCLLCVVGTLAFD